MKTTYLLLSFPEDLKTNSFFAVTIEDRRLVLIDAEVPAPQMISPEEAAARLPVPLEQLDTLPYRYETIIR